MSIFAPEFVFLHRRRSTLMELPKVFLEGKKKEAALLFPAVAQSRDRNPTSWGSGENIFLQDPEIGEQKGKLA